MSADSRLIELVAKPLARLLETLEFIAQEHDEIFDTDVREALSNAIFRLFIEPEKNSLEPMLDFAMFTDRGNRAVASALGEFNRQIANLIQDDKYSRTDRLIAFQNLDVTSPSGYSYDDFFGHADD